MTPLAREQIPHRHRRRRQRDQAIHASRMYARLKSIRLAYVASAANPLDCGGTWHPGFG